MRVSRAFAAALLVLTAVLLQVTAFNRIPLPRAHPQLLVAVVVSVALVEGPLTGASVGFAAGLVADLLSEHALGQVALVLALVGYGCGLLRGEEDRSVGVPILAIAVATAGAVLANAGLGLVLGSPGLAAAPLGISAAAGALYAALLAPFVFPVVRGLFRRLDVERR